jgi:transposase-like protein
LSPSTVQRLTESWRVEHAEWAARDLGEVDYVYVWADGVYVNVRLPDADGAQDRLCLLVIVGVRPDGRKELVAVADGHREDTGSRGMGAPALAVGDGALGFWGALRQVFPGTAEQRCWVHKTANVLSALPKHPEAKRLLADIYTAETRSDAVEAVNRFATDLAAHPKATAKVTGELDQLLAFYHFPGEHWRHLRTTNAIGSTFATVRLCQRVTNGPGCREASVAMGYKLMEAAQHRWRAITARELTALVRAGATFIDGKLQERSTEEAHPTVKECAA